MIQSIRSLSEKQYILHVWDNKHKRLLAVLRRPSTVPPLVICLRCRYMSRTLGVCWSNLLSCTAVSHAHSRQLAHMFMISMAFINMSFGQEAMRLAKENICTHHHSLCLTPSYTFIKLVITRIIYPPPWQILMFLVNWKTPKWIKIMLKYIACSAGRYLY